VFAPGVKNADESIRIGDEVIIMKNMMLCAVGVALMNGKEMVESSHGEAVKIRHHI
jgi:predicted RNA-binding protein (TIGR00451 family)